MLTLAGKPLAVPVLQGGMGVGVSLGGLAGAVAACGGMGCISTADTGYREPDFARDPCAANLRALKKEIAKAKEIANGAGLVAINAMVATQNYADAVRTAVEAGVDAIVSGAGLPLELPGLVKKLDVALAPIVSSGRAAKLILRRWAKAFNRTADFVVIEGCKAGGHLGFSEEELLAGKCQTLDEILPEVLAEVKPLRLSSATTSRSLWPEVSTRARTSPTIPRWVLRAHSSPPASSPPTSATPARPIKMSCWRPARGCAHHPQPCGNAGPCAGHSAGAEA